MKDVVLYRFEDGWKVRRVLELSERIRLTGRELWLADHGLFGLYDATGTPRSSVDLDNLDGPPFSLDAGRSMFTPKEMAKPTDPAVERYWISFVSECIDEAAVSQIAHGVDMRLRVPLDAWWAEHTMPGHCLFDLEPYALLDVDSPFVLPDEPFWGWYAAQEGLT